jgi:hypothetical protein
VELAGVVADAEALGDPLVGEALGEELEHFEITGCQGLGQLFGRSGGVAEEDRREGLVEGLTRLGVPRNVDAEVSNMYFKKLP